MEYEFTGRHIEVSPAIVTHTREHLDKLNKILDSAPAKAHVILSVEKRRHIAEIVVSWRDHQFTGLSTSMDMYQSITFATVKIETQVIRLKKKFVTRHKSGAGRKAIETESVRPAPPAATAARIVRSRRYEVKPMTPEEAVQMVSQSVDQFVVFRDAETDRIGVIYKRKDGNFGLIEP